MEVLFHYIFDSAMMFLLLLLTQISSLFLLRISNEILKKNDFKKSYLANIVSILLVIFTLSILADFIFIHPADPFIIIGVIIVTPVIAMVAYVCILFIASIIHLEKYYSFLPTYRITHAIVYLNLVAIFGLSLYFQDYERSYALYGDDMDKILKIHSNCGAPPRCIGIEYNIFYNTKVTAEVLEEVVKRHPVSGIACRAMENPNATEEQIRRWSNMGWAFKRCADRILAGR